MSAVPNAQTATPVSPFGVSFPAVRRFSVDEYHRMIESGILGKYDRVELVDGWIVEMSPIGPPHATGVALLVAKLQEQLPRGWFLRAQLPITTANSEPEPDIAVVRGTIRDYGQRHPGSPDIGIIIEVSDATLQFDRIQKRKQYAVANIAEYWIVNLVNRQLEIHRQPQNGDYSTVEVLRSGDTASCLLSELATVSVPVSDILP